MRREERQKRWGVCSWLTGAAFVLALAAALLSRASVDFADRWRRLVLSAWVGPLSGLSRALPLSLAEGLVCALAVALVVALLRRPRMALRLTAACLVLALAGALGLWYPLYFAPSGQPYAIETTADAAALARLADALIDDLAALDAAALFPEDLPAQAAAAMAALAELNAPPLPDARPQRGLPGWLSTLRLAGFYAPWTAEALYSSNQPPAAQPFTACHELAHLYGVADEGQASVAAFRACARAGGALRRSADLHALACTLPRLRQLDEDTWTRCTLRLDADSRESLSAIGGLTGGHPPRSPLLAAALDWLGIAAETDSYAGLADYLAAHSDIF